MGAVWYATREALKGALDVAETARNDTLIDRALGYGSLAVEGQLHRHFAPYYGTRYFDWPRPQDRPPSWRLDLYEDEVARVDQLESGGTVLDPSWWELEPVNAGPPYTSIELRRNMPGSFGGPTPQRAIGVTGVFAGCPLDDRLAGTLASTISASASTLALTAGSEVGVGSILLAGTERMIVTGRNWADSGVNTGGTLAANKAATGLVVTDTSTFTPGDLLYLDAEQLLVQDVVGSALVVKRAWNGTVLAAHNSGIDVYVSRSFRADRGQLGTTPAGHASSSSVLLFHPPALVVALTLAEAVMYLQNEGSGWARVVGSGDGTREAAGRALKDLRDQAWTALARKVRGGAV